MKQKKRVFSCFMALVIAMGLTGAHAPVAFADVVSEEQNQEENKEEEKQDQEENKEEEEQDQEENKEEEQDQEENKEEEQDQEENKKEEKQDQEEDKEEEKQDQEKNKEEEKQDQEENKEEEKQDQEEDKEEEKEIQEIINTSEINLTIRFSDYLDKEQIQEQNIILSIYQDGEKIGQFSINEAEKQQDSFLAAAQIKEDEIQIHLSELKAGNYFIEVMGTDFDTKSMTVSLKEEETKEESIDIQITKVEEEEIFYDFKSLFLMAEPLPVLDVQASGSIGTTIRFDYPQEKETIKEQNIKVSLFQQDTKIAETTLFGEKENTIEVIAKDKEGIPIELSGSEQIYYMDIIFSGLEPDSYHLQFEGKGYKKYTSDIVIDKYGKHLIVGTSDNTFTVGDVNQDEQVNEQDLALVVQALGAYDSQCDINCDGEINIIDIAYVNHQRNVSGEEKQYDTNFLKLGEIKTAFSQDFVNIEGNVEDLFQAGSSAVKLTPKNGLKEIAIPIEFDNAIEMQQINVVSPAGDGAVESGTAILEYEDGTMEEIPFGETAPQGVRAIESKDANASVTIQLGKRVAVKKIVIKVTAVKSQEGGIEYAVVQEIQFLKDIVPENPTPAHVTVKNIKVEEGNESVTLTWNELPNITGYEVRYGTESGNYTEKLAVTVNQATVTQLENLTTYYFVVVPTSGNWTGNLSAEVAATPQPSKAPSAPDQLKAEPMDSAIKFSWQKAENATYYKVYYRLPGSEFILVKNKEEDSGEITGTSQIIGQLENGKEYEMYVIAGNAVGESKPSLTVTSTPFKQDISKPEGIPDGDIDDRIIEIKMPHKDYYDHDAYPNGFDVKNVADGDYTTHWTARAFWESSAFTYTFDNPVEMNYVIYVPRLDGKFKNSLYTYGISIDSTGNGEFKQIAKGLPVRNNPAQTGFAILPFEKSTVKSIKVSTAQWAGSPTNVSLSEILFYEYDKEKDINGEVTALFANNTFTELRSGVTAEEITRLKQKLEENGDYLIEKEVLQDELELAEKLYQNQENALGVMHQQLYQRSGLQPLGVAAKAGNTVTIYADIPEGEKVSVVATQYYAEASKWKQEVVASLENGRNVVTIPQIHDIKGERGGSLYYQYTGTRGNEISLQVRRATDIPTLELTDWYQISEAERRNRIDTYVTELNAYKVKGNLETAVLNCTEISMPNALLSIPADRVSAALAKTDQPSEQLYNNVLAWEDVMHIVKTTHGIDETRENTDITKSRQNVRYMRMFAGAFMFAAGSYIGIGYQSCGGMVSGSPIENLTSTEKNGLFGWGIGHEIGHNMDLLGKAEITNNIYSMMIQTYDGKDNVLLSRLETSGKYEEIWQKVSSGAPGAANNVFVQLGMYWQLHLAYDDGEASNPMKFYNEFSKEWSKGNANGYSYDDRVAVVASKVTGKNLIEFFTRWGMILSEDAKAEIQSSTEAENRAIWYFNDEARRYRIAGGTGFDSSASVEISASVENNKEVTIQMNLNGTENDLLGYEILRNGKPIGFTQKPQYVDIIGTANHMSFTYQVKAIDKLGNATPLSNRTEIKISYDTLVSAEKYTTTNENGVTIITMTEPTDITGIKVLNAPTTGSFTVRIKTPQSEGFITAKNGDFSVNQGQNSDSYVGYFTKPNAQPEDARMWTYEAKEIEITGIAEGTEIGLISYPGDNIEFDQLAVGRLQKDYQYGNDTEDVIKAGTLVITGTYRGDPVYNVVQVMGRFEKNTPEEETTSEERALAGYSLLFAEIPEDGEVSDISNGIFFFVPDVQAEAELQKEEWSSCNTDSLLPAMIKAQLYRTDDPNQMDSNRLVSDTIWVTSPAGDDMPTIIITAEGGNKE